MPRGITSNSRGMVDKLFKINAPRNVLSQANAKRADPRIHTNLNESKIALLL